MLWAYELDLKVKVNFKVRHRLFQFVKALAIRYSADLCWTHVFISGSSERRRYDSISPTQCDWSVERGEHVWRGQAGRQSGQVGVHQPMTSAVMATRLAHIDMNINMYNRIYDIDVYDRSFTEFYCRDKCDNCFRPMLQHFRASI